MLMIKRKVSLKSYWVFLLDRPILFTLTIIYLSFVLFWSTLFYAISSFIPNPEPLDHQQIIENGYEEKAEITDIQIDHSTSINSVNPIIISYSWMNGSTQTRSYYKAMPTKIENLAIGDSVTIMVYKNKSTIPGIKPFQFPWQIFKMIPIFVILLFSSPLFIVWLLPFFKINLYKRGELRKASILYLAPAGLFKNRVRVYFQLTNSNAYKYSSLISDKSILEHASRGHVYPALYKKGSVTLIDRKIADMNGWDYNSLQNDCIKGL